MVGVVVPFLVAYFYVLFLLSMRARTVVDTLVHTVLSEPCWINKVSQYLGQYSDKQEV